MWSPTNLVSFRRFVAGLHGQRPTTGAANVPPLISWTDRTHHTQPAGCKASQTVEAVAVAWDQHYRHRTQRVLQDWASRDTRAVETRAAGLRRAIADADWDTVERHGGFDVVMEEIDQWEQENPASNGREMIDDFRLRGSRRWSRTNASPKKPWWRTGVARDFNHPNVFLSEGGVLAVVVESFPVASGAIEASLKGEGEGSGGGDGGARGELSPVGGSKGPEPLASPNVLHWVGWLLGTTRCGAGPAVPPRTTRRTRRVQVVRATPPF